MTKTKARWGLALYSGGLGCWVLSYLINGGWWRLAGAGICVVGIGECVRKLVKR